MSYPEPLEGDTAESLYAQAIFFYREYERLKAEIEQAREVLADRTALQEKAEARVAELEAHDANGD